MSLQVDSGEVGQGARPTMVPKHQPNNLKRFVGQACPLQGLLDESGLKDELLFQNILIP